jgi:hypothetical protein
MVTTPVVYKNNWVAVHCWRMSAATTYVIDRIGLINCSGLDGLFWDKPNAGLAPHAL